MKINVITSKDNILIKKAGYLKKHQSNKHKNKYDCFIVEGFIPIQSAIDNKYEMVDVFTTQKLYDEFKKEINELSVCKKINLIPENSVKEFSNLENAKPIFASFKYPLESKLVLNENEGKYLLLDNIQDPGNLGTILRTSLALGMDAICLFNCVSIYNQKTIKSSMGAVFNNKIHIVYDWEPFINFLKDNKYHIYGSLINKKASKLENVVFDKKSVLILGNEANGINENHYKDLDSKIYIPMLNEIQSLNVGIAGGIMIYHMVNNLKK